MININRIYEIRTNLKKSFLYLNLFPSSPPSTNLRELQNQRISTRFFILFLSISLIILILYRSLILIDKVIRIEGPNYSTYVSLYSTYSNNLQCQCKRISVNYKRFVELNYTMNYICTSGFVTEEWIKYLENKIHDSSNVLYNNDFRMIGSVSFQALRTLCHLTKKIIDDSLNSFYTSQYVSAFITSFDLFKKHIESQIEQFISSTTDRFVSSLELIRKTTHINNLFSAALTNYDFYIPNQLGYFIGKAIVYSNCSCAENSSCSAQALIYDGNTRSILFVVPGFFVGCYVIESLLGSTLECFHDEQCFEQIKFHIRPLLTTNLTILNSSTSSRYSSKTKIQQMIDQLMIEQWTRSIVYEKYYVQCQPMNCFYQIQTRHDLIEILTTIVGLIGGLVTVLMIFVPIVVKWVRREKINSSLTFNLKIRVFRFLNLIKIKLIDFNMFSSIHFLNDQNERQNQKISTRLFLLLILCSIIILLFYNSLIVVTKTIKTERPNYIKYLDLYSKYSNRLECPCKEISIEYGKFVKLNYTMHEICTSMFISDQWIRSQIQMNVRQFYFDNFENVKSFFFQGLRDFCQMIKDFIEKSLKSFYSSQSVNGLLIGPTLFQIETEAQIQRFISTSANRFLFSLKIIRGTTHVNNLLSVLQTNSYLYQADDVPDNVYVKSINYRDCSCLKDLSCFSPSVLYDPNDPSKFINIKGFFTGCYVVESILRSSLQCFYDEQCLDLLKLTSDSSVIANLTFLNVSKSNHFKEETTIEEMINQLMIEKWNFLVSFENYFDECQPTTCVHTVQERNGVVYVITTVIGLTGGLIKIFKFVIPWIVLSFRRILRLKRSNFHSISRQQILILQSNFKVYVTDFNIFRSVPPSTDFYQIRNEKISTRLFVLLLIISLIILLLYNSLIIVIKTTIIEKPNYSEYIDLYSNYSNQLQCPCKKISVNYEKFLKIDYELHHVCRSVFVSDEWIQFLTELNIGEHNIDEFQQSSSFAFQGLRSLCLLSKQIIENNLKNFYSSEYVNGFLISSDFFRKQIEEQIQQFLSSTTNEFSLSFQMIRKTTQANVLFPSLQSHHRIFMHDTTNIHTRTIVYDGCSCMETSSCSTVNVLLGFNGFLSVFPVNGFYTGCYVIESLLRSTLQCFHDEECLSRVMFYLESPFIPVESLLNTSMSTRYTKQTAIEEMINQLMIEKWNSSISFENYFHECQPTQCTFIVNSRNHIIYIITTLIGLMGGLWTVLRFTVPLIVKFVMKFRRNFRKVYPKLGRI